MFMNHIISKVPDHQQTSIGIINFRIQIVAMNNALSAMNIKEFINSYLVRNYTKWFKPSSCIIKENNIPRKESDTAIQDKDL